MAPLSATVAPTPAPIIKAERRDILRQVKPKYLVGNIKSKDFISGLIWLGVN